MEATVCIPAYRSGAFLAATLESVLDQELAPREIHVRIDPCPEDGTGAAGDTLQALAAFRGEPRLRVWRNPGRLGWDGNIRAMLGEVRTPLFSILPHDDLYLPGFLAALREALDAGPPTGLAYCDMRTTGPGGGWHKSVRLPGPADRAGQLLHFFLEGAEAMPWRGLTRTASALRAGGFPVDGHAGFAVECEYALALLAEAPAVHLPRVHYVKRLHPAGVMSASRARIAGVDEAARLAAWRQHERRMASLTEGFLERIGADAPTASTVRAARRAAMWRRRQLAVSPRLPGDVLAAIPAEFDALVATGSDASLSVAARLALACSRHLSGAGEPALAAQWAEQAVAADPRWEEGLLFLARIRLRQHRLEEAAALADRAERSHPGWNGIAELRRDLERRTQGRARA